MALKIFIDSRYRNRETEFLSICGKLNRLIFPKRAYDNLKNICNQETVDSVQVLVNDEQPGIFWIKPCQKTDEGSRVLGATSKNTRSLGIRSLLKYFNWDSKDRIRVLSIWDMEVMALRVDLNQKIIKKNLEGLT